MNFISYYYYNAFRPLLAVSFETGVRELCMTATRCCHDVLSRAACSKRHKSSRLFSLAGMFSR